MTEWLNRVHFGDCLKTLRRMPDGIVQTCVTSPPYFGLRDYGHPGQIGLEATPDEFVQKLVEVFREVRRVLRDDGTCWVNMGDSYAGSWGAQSPEHAGKHAPNVSAMSANQAIAAQRKAGRTGSIPPGSGLKPKDLIGVPWMLAFALRDDGWWLRQDVIWNKPNPMPESTGSEGRCTKAHEYIFLLAKSADYYFDFAAIQEPAADASLQRWAQDVESQQGSYRVPGKTNGPMKAVGGARRSRDTIKRERSKRSEAIPGQTAGTHRADREDDTWDTSMRRKRSVWTVSTKPYNGAHFATFPEDLIEPCILAGAPAGGVVLDPFMGSGTTAAVATRLGRQFIGCELNESYRALQDERLAGQTMGLELA